MHHHSKQSIDTIMYSNYTISTNTIASSSTTMATNDTRRGSTKRLSLSIISYSSSDSSDSRDELSLLTGKQGCVLKNKVLAVMDHCKQHLYNVGCEFHDEEPVSTNEHTKLQSALLDYARHNQGITELQRRVWIDSLLNRNYNPDYFMFQVDKKGFLDYIQASSHLQEFQPQAKFYKRLYDFEQHHQEQQCHDESETENDEGLLEFFESFATFYKNEKNANEAFRCLVKVTLKPLYKEMKKLDTNKEVKRRRKEKKKQKLY